MSPNRTPSSSFLSALAVALLSSATVAAASAQSSNHHGVRGSTTDGITTSDKRELWMGTTKMMPPLPTTGDGTKMTKKEMDTSKSFDKLTKKDSKWGKKDKGGTGKKADKGDSKPKDVQPVILDTDYGSFIDDVFALGLLINSADLLDTKMVITTSEQPELTAKCVWQHIQLSELDYEIPVAVGKELPPYEARASVCGIPGLVGFALEAECTDVDADVIDDGLAAMAKMIMESDRDDWWYIVIGGQTTLKALVVEYPEAAAKIDTVIIMGGNWCIGFEPYPGVEAPTDETNIGCDPVAANFVLDQRNVQFNNVYYTPVEVADVIGNEDYKMIVDAAESGASPSAKATLEFYLAWSAAGRASPDLLIHAEAMQYDPLTESTPQFDACAVMLALELAASKKCDAKMALYEFPAIHFYEKGDPGLATFPNKPLAGFSQWEGKPEYDLPSTCPGLTPYTFDPDDTPEEETPVMIGLGYTDSEAKTQFYYDMALRMAGGIPECSRRRRD